MRFAVRHGERIEPLIAAFEKQCRSRPEGIAEAPGRVNLIGEHVDYNDGLVLPFAIDRSVLCAWGRTRDRILTWYSLDSSEPPQLIDVAEFDDFDDVAVVRNWMDYGMGVVWSLTKAGHRVHGTATSISGNVPQGAGLSSSAALEVAVAGAMRDAFSLPIDDVELARLCQRAENEYVGVQCGIMDQLAAVLGQDLLLLGRVLGVVLGDKVLPEPIQMIAEQGASRVRNDMDGCAGLCLHCVLLLYDATPRPKGQESRPDLRC